MTALRQILRLIGRDRGADIRRGLILSVLAVISGLALLALSGWFLVAAGMAGLAGAGAVFDVFRPSAGVRFLAIARTASRYGERLLSHDATLKALTSLRLRLLAGLATADFTLLYRLRSGQALNRLTADVDALDGLTLRLVLPGLSGVIAASIALTGLWFLTFPLLALWIVGIPALGAMAVLILTAHAGEQPAREAEARHQALRAAIIDHLRGRDLLVMAGRLPAAREALLAEDHAARAAALRQAGVEWRAAAAMQLASALGLAGALWLAGHGVAEGRIDAPRAALAVFAALAMGEIWAALPRGMAELGRMRDAASRIVPLLEERPTSDAPRHSGQGLTLVGLTVPAIRGGPPIISDLDLAVFPGESVAVTGASGRGKSALLNCIAGLVPPLSGEVRAGGGMGYLLQRPALIAGSLRDNLRLARPDASDDDCRAVLDHCRLDLPLDHALGEGGTGLSGGQTRRLALARVLIRRPDVLLLDEPTEGLDAATAEAVLQGVRTWLPEAAILIAAHRPAERRMADHVVHLGKGR